jgi:3'-phosphoadenosine 5'-phosphosulfate sulfotransferase (PAPS reductase)/FAD synthetase
MKHIIGLSGGKDSTALALRLAEVEPREYEYICNETGNELPTMQEHWRKLEELLNAPIKRVRYSKDLVGTIDQMHMLPSTLARWCTRVLKIEPTIEYMAALPAGSVLYVGLRADEEERKGLFGEDIAVRFPMREWGWKEADVWAYLASRGVEIPLRTDCALCPYQRLGEWRDLYFNYPDLWALGVSLEKKWGATFRSPSRDTWPAGLDALGKEFAAGRPLRGFKNKSQCRVCSL